MLRFVSERRRVVIAVGVTGSVLVVLWLWGTQQTTARAVQWIEDRLGLDATIDSVDLGPGRVDLDRVVLRGIGGGLEIRADRVSARIAPWSALFSIARAVREVTAERVEVAVDLGDPGIDESLAELERRLAARRTTSGARASQSSGGRAYEAVDVVVQLRDADGPLVDMQISDAVKRPGTLHSTITETLIGDPNADHARVGRTTVSLQREGGGWVLHDLSIEGARVRWRGGSSEPIRPLALRLREAARTLRSVRPEAPPEAIDPAQATESPRDATPRLLSRVSEEATISLSDVDVESRTPGGHLERIHNLEAQLIGNGNGWFEILAGGEMSNDGTLNVDLRVHPREASAEGSLVARGISLALIAPFVPEIPFHDAEAGTVSATLDLDAESSDHVQIEGRVGLRNAALASERIAPDPVEDIAFEVGGEGSWFPAERRLVIDEAIVRLGRARLLIEGMLEKTVDHYLVSLSAKLPPTPCNDVVGAIPSDVLGPLEAFAWSGSWAGMARVVLDSRDLDDGELLLRVRDLCEFERAPRWARVERFTRPFRHSVLEPDESTFEMVTGPGTDEWVSLSEVSPFLVQAIISHEDARFYDHGGFAPWAIRDALVRNLQEGRYVVGASTISMQLAKNLYLQREKTIARKVQEVILTWWLENALSKDEILELYLNVIEYGPRVYGLRNASMHYFGRPPSDLSPAESAFLACILPSPKRFHMYYERDGLTRSIRGKIGRLLEHMAERERIGADALAYGLAELDEFEFQQVGDPPPLVRSLPPVGTPSDDQTGELDPFEALFIAP